MDDYPKRFAFHPSYFDSIMGTARVREALESGAAGRAHSGFPAKRNFTDSRN